MADNPIWVIMPFLNSPEMTLQAVEDCLNQSVPTRVLLVNQGASQEVREQIDQYVDGRGDYRVLVWSFLPMLPSLSAVWNRALQFVWELGGEVALVANNDLRLARGTVECLQRVMEMEKALFVSAVGVREASWPTDPPQDDPHQWASAFHDGPMYSKGGPDYSCFLIAHAGHWSYPFDEKFIPAFFEDLDSHRRYMLGGDGQRIFSINVPYLHYASGTLKNYTPEERTRFNKQSARNREYYHAKWGGPVNEETFLSPFGAHEPPGGGVCTATPDLQRRCLAGLHPYDDTPSAPRVAEDTHNPSVGVPAGGSAGTAPVP